MRLSFSQDFNPAEASLAQNQQNPIHQEGCLYEITHYRACLS